MISKNLQSFKKDASKTILVVALLLSLFSGFTTSKSSATISKTQSEWVIRDERKLNLTSPFKSNSTRSSIAFSDHSQVARQLFYNKLVEIKLKSNKKQFSLIDLTFQLSHFKILPLSSDEDHFLV
jgi:Na+-transporting NADH:ubiquinone oxidoreductase subunit NqrC